MDQDGFPGYGHNYGLGQPQPELLSYMGPSDPRGGLYRQRSAIPSPFGQSLLQFPSQGYGDGQGDDHGQGHYQGQQTPPFVNASFDAVIYPHRVRPPDIDDFSSHDYAQTQQTPLELDGGAPSQNNSFLDFLGCQASGYHQQPGYGAPYDQDSLPQVSPRAVSWNPVIAINHPRTPPYQGTPDASPNLLANQSVLNEFTLSQPSYAQPSSTATTATWYDNATYLSPSTVAPTLDGVSSRSDTSNALVCMFPGCQKTSKDSRSHTRHLDDVHGDEKYICVCSYMTSRKGNMKRHSKTCKKRLTLTTPFICRCGELERDLAEYLPHIEGCGKKKAGRRPGRSGGQYIGSPRVYERAFGLS
ncbi:hypothetical protein G7046_g4817 [Stylonectria norvegica]|nr:hypothetical protein G7046_g4817 [Stylonectria norvegica]